MAKQINSHIEEVTWQEVSTTIAKTSQKLAAIIDNLDPSKEFTLFRIRYPFGTKLLEDTLFHIPDDTRAIPIGDSSTPEVIQKKLGYSPFPLGIVVKNCIEVFREINDKVFSTAFYGNGLDLGVWEHFGWTTPYSITSGARSLYMLPKISDTYSHKKLKYAFGINASPPKRPYDHWEVFKQLASSPQFPEKWYCEVIFFTNKWVENITTNKAWVELKLYLWNKGWIHSGYARYKSILDVAWEIFSRTLSEKELRVDPYVIDTLKHLIFIGTGTVPASAPHIGNDEAGPLNAIQKIYEDVNGYGLKSYIATIMQPYTFSILKDRPAYYSLQIPTFLASNPRTKKATSTMDNIRELQEIIQRFMSIDYWPKLQLTTSFFHDIIRNLQFDFFHGEAFAYGDTIRPSKEIPDQDTHFLYDPLNKKSKRFFAHNSNFLRGCIRISKIKEK